jgi:ketosteroid isomerase-like protein
MAQSTSTDIRYAIVAANGQLMEAFSRGDAVSAAAAYTEQGQVLPPNGEVVAGKQAIQTFWQGAMDMGIKTVTLETNEVEGYSNTAHEVGRYTLQGDGGRVLDTGKYVVIWKQEAGQWKLHRDIWNSSRPAPVQHSKIA